MEFIFDGKLPLLKEQFVPKHHDAVVFLNFGPFGIGFDPWH